MTFPLDIKDPFPGIKLIIILISRNLEYITFCKENKEFCKGISDSSADNAKLTPDFMYLKTIQLIKIVFSPYWFDEGNQIEASGGLPDAIIKSNQEALKLINDSSSRNRRS